MAFTQLTDDLDIIAKLGDKPNTDDGLTASQLKAKFDIAGNLIKTFINGTLLQQAAQKPVGSGIVKSTNGFLSVAEEDVDYQSPLTEGVDYVAPGTFEDHAEDETIHVTSSEKTTWSGKQDALSDNQKRHIFVRPTEPEEAVDGDIWFKVVDETEES